MTMTCLRFDNNAQALRGKLEAEHLGLMRLEAINGKLAAHIGKYDGLFGRLCVAFHCIKHAYDSYLPATVTEDTATCVAEFMRRFLAAARLRVLRRRPQARRRP